MAVIDSPVMLPPWLSSFAYFAASTLSLEHRLFLIDGYAVLVLEGLAFDRSALATPLVYLSDFFRIFLSPVATVLPMSLGMLPLPHRRIWDIDVAH
jgi:hypothetical protein